jgi:hypothetical protein
MSTATDFLENKIISHVLGIAAFPQPGALTLALHTASPTETGNANELAGGAYARQTVTFALVAAGSPNAANSALVRFDGLPAATITHASIWSGGDALIYMTLVAPLTITAGQPLEFDVGSLVVEVS